MRGTCPGFPGSQASQPLKGQCASLWGPVSHLPSQALGKSVTSRKVWQHPGLALQNLGRTSAPCISGMGKEVGNLLLENSQLLETK